MAARSARRVWDVRVPMTRDQVQTALRALTGPTYDGPLVGALGDALSSGVLIATEDQLERLMTVLDASR